jgi:hypothetical protein
VPQELGPQPVATAGSGSVVLVDGLSNQARAVVEDNVLMLRDIGMVTADAATVNSDNPIFVSNIDTG